jgi:hypothetical protein
MIDQLKATGKLGTDQKVEDKVYKIPATATIAQATVYGPWKNLFLASYFASTGVHGLHVIGGMIPLAILTIQATGDPQEDLPPPHGVRRPVLALRRPGLDLPVPAAVFDLSGHSWRSHF